MSEVITEMILPGTYIEVRAEGLLTIGAIATGNIGVLGSAERGDAAIHILSSFEEGQALYGGMGDWNRDEEDTNLSLVRSLRLMFDNGASTVYARRIFVPPPASGDSTAVSTDMPTPAAIASYTLSDKGGALTLRAKTPGTWGNRLEIRVEGADSDELVVDEVISSTTDYKLSAQSIVNPNEDGKTSLGTVIIRQNGLSQRLPMRTDAAKGQTAAILNRDSRVVTLDPAPSEDTLVTASYSVPKDHLRKITLRFGSQQEVYIVPSLSYLKQRLQNPVAPSQLVDVEGEPGDGLPQLTTTPMTFSGGQNGSIIKEMFQNPLDELLEQDVQILVVLRKFSDVRDYVLGHVERTENLGRERIALMGVDSSAIAKVLENANEVADKRVILVAPGIREQNSAGQIIDLPPYYAAAAVAGKLGSLAPHISPTNKTLAVKALTTEYNYGDLKSAVQNRVLVLQKKRGIRVVKGITTHDEAFKQITLRRIVDYVKEGTRLGANQYIGKLNNKRVRENLRTTLDNFLSDLVLREFLTGYKLTVSATRAMEINGQVLVTMDIYPTFSIDVVRVVLNLM